MMKRAIYTVAAAAFLSMVVPISGLCGTTLSQTSGINSSDTWATFDMTIETNATVDLSSSYYDPQTKTTTSQIPVTPPPPKRSTLRLATTPTETLF
jgi:hypothetical protein